MTPLKTAAPPLPDESNASETAYIPVRPLYTPDDLREWDYDRDLSYP
jgi:hypothetical protein